MKHLRTVELNRSAIASLVAVTVVVGLILGYLVVASGANANDRSLQIGDSSVGKNTTYNLSFDTGTPGVLGSVRVEFCTDSPLANRPCTAPVGFDISQANIISQSGPGGFIVSGATTSNVLVLTRTPGFQPITTTEIRLNNVINPSTPGPYYARIYTYPTANASGSETDFGGLAFQITNEITINAEVPPFLTFCTGLKITGLNCETATGDYIDLGELSSKKTSASTSQMLVATNAANGYAITASGATLTSGNNEINQLISGDVSRPGVAQFGLNLRANSTPSIGNNAFGPGTGSASTGYNQPNIFRFVSGEGVASSSGPDDKRQYTASYLVNVGAVQPAGIYVTTITYVCLANF